MSEIPVKMITPTNQALHRLRQVTNTVHDEICQRAFCLFEQKGCQGGHEMEDWLAAEREVLFCPPSELDESSSQIRIETVVPGIDARTLQVDVLPNSITIEGTIGEKRLLRRYDLSGRIDPDEVEATLHDGVLQIIARKLASEEKIAERAAG